MTSLRWLCARFGLLVAAYILGLVFTLHSASAQETPAEAPPEGSAEQVEGLIGTLEDEQARTELIAQLRLMIAAEQQEEEAAALETFGARILGLLEARLAAISQQFDALGTAVFNLPQLWDWAQQEFASDIRRAQWENTLLALLVVLGSGIVALILTRLVLRGPRRILERPRTDDRFFDRLLILIGRTLIDLLPFIIFGLVAYGAMAVFDPIRKARLVCVAGINAVLIAAAVLVVARAVFTPLAPHLRLVRTSDETANYFYVWIRRLTYLCVAGFLVTEVGLTLGMSLGLSNGIIALIGLVAAGMVIVFVLQNRGSVAQFLGGTKADGEETPGNGEEQETERGPVILSLRRMLADIWHILAIIYVIIAYGVFALSIEGGFIYMIRATVLSVVVLLAAHFLSRLAVGAIDRIFFASANLKARGPSSKRRPNRLLPLVARIVRVVFFAVALAIVLDIWGLGTLELLRGDFGQALLSSAASIALVLGAAFVAWQIVSQIVTNQLAKAEKAGRPPHETQRMRTLLPLFRNVALVVLITIATFITLSELGINIAPLLAGAGVVGLAIGFGAQTLVKDVITGLFNIIENTIAIGDVVQVGGHAGLVEGMTIRTVKLRDLAGSVHTVPFSDVTSVLNMTRDFSYYVFDVGVAYRENVDDVIEVLKEIGAGMETEIPYSALILEPIEILGVDAFADSAVIIKARIKTTPINQWTVGREFNRRMKNRFDELGIEIPFPHMTLYFGEDKQGKAPSAPLALSAPDLVAALAGRPGEDEAAKTRRQPKQPAVEPSPASGARGDDEAVSTPGHDGDH